MSGEERRETEREGGREKKRERSEGDEKNGRVGKREAAVKSSDQFSKYALPLRCFLIIVIAIALPAAF